jgi:hypothetical protein
MFPRSPSTYPSIPIGLKTSEKQNHPQPREGGSGEEKPNETRTQSLSLEFQSTTCFISSTNKIRFVDVEHQRVGMGPDTKSREQERDK